jgi:carboxypeptidase C (cathepsin A)
MKKPRPTLLAAVALLSFGMLSASGAEPPAPATKGEPAKAEEKDKGAKSQAKEPEVKPKEVSGSVRVEGKVLKYVAQTGLLPIFKEDGSIRANVFYVYYAAADANGERLSKGGASTRPLMFCFNGGPGSSAVWLHLGGLGPKRVDTLLDGRSPQAIAPMVENPNTVLDATDLVFIDPVSTGLSRAVTPEEEKTLLGVEEDIESVAEFLRVFCTREKRWESPKFLCGESYGGIRGGGLAGLLQSKHGMYLHGVQIVSGLLNYQTISSPLGNDLPYVLGLPTFTNVAHHHGKLPPDLQADRVKAEADSRRFAFGEYASALLRGSSLPEEERQKVAAQLARFTGLSLEQVLEQNLRLNRFRFRKQVLKSEGKVVGGYDARVVAEDFQNEPDGTTFDPSAAFLKGSVSAAVNAYVREGLGYESDHPYRVMAPVNWNYTQHSNQFVSMERRLTEALVQNPRMKVLLQVGRCDLVVPQDAMRYSVNQMPLPKSLLGNIKFEEYASGHMMYFHLPDAEKFRADTVRFIRETTR